jgi:hypothetical protein
MRSHENYPKARTEQLIIEEVEDEAVAYDLQTNVAHALKPLAAAVFSCADGGSSVAEIAAQVSRRLGEPVSGDQVEDALAELENVSLLERPSLDVLTQDPISRRTALKAFLAAGAGTFLITSVAAPAAMANNCDSSAGTTYSCVTGTPNGKSPSSGGVGIYNSNSTAFYPVAAGSAKGTCSYYTKSVSKHGNTTWTAESGTYQCLPCDGKQGYTCCQVVCGPTNLGGKWGSVSDCYKTSCYSGEGYQSKYCSTCSER